MAASEVKPDPKDKVVHTDHAKDTAPQIAALPAADQRAAVKKELERVSATSGSTLPELTIANSKEKPLAVISKDGKAVEVVDESGKTWKADGKNLFSDGNEQRLLAPKMVDGKPATNADGTPQYDLMQVKTTQESNPDGSKRQVVTQITDGDGRKWASVDGQNFVGAAGANGAQAGDQRVLKDNNGSLEFTDPKGGQLSEDAVKGKEQDIQALIKQNTGFFGGVDGRNLNKVLENTAPDLLARYDKDLKLRDTLKDKMNSRDYEDMTRILDGATSNIKAHADRIFANGTGNSGADAKPSEQEVKRLLLQTNSADMPKLNDALLSRINGDPEQKQQYDQYVEQHKNDPGFDSKNAAILAFSQNFSKETQDSIPLLTKGNDQLDTAVGGTTPRQQLIKQALDNKDFDSFKTAVTGAPAEARAAISKDAVDKVFSNIEWSDKANQRNLDIAHDLINKGEIQPDTTIKYSNMEQADKVLSNLTPEQRASYNQGKDNPDPNNPDRQFYNKMQEAFKGAAGGDAAKMLRLDDEARKQDGSYISTMTDHQHMLMNDWSQAVANKLDTMTPEQRKDMADKYDERRKQLSDMVTALNDDPKVVLDKFDQMFKKTAPDADTSAGALLGNLRDVQSKVYAQQDDIYGTAAASAKADAVAQTLQKAFTADPDLFNRLKNPQTESEKQLAAQLKDQDTLFGDSKKYYGSLSTEGHLSISDALRLDRGDFAQATKDILAASPEDQKRFLSDPVEGKKDLGSLASESNVDQKYELMKNILQQGKMQPEDQARAVALGWGKPEDLKALTGLDNQTGSNYQKKYGEDLQNSLLNKYGHQDNSVNDFLSKYNNVFQKADDQSHEAAVAGSGWASKILDNTGSMTPQEMDVAATHMADMSAKLQKQLDTAPDSIKPEMQAFIDAQKRLKDATDKHEDATKQMAEAADKAVALAATAAVIAATGGAAAGVLAPAVMEAIATTAIVGGAASRIALKEELLGPNWKDKEKEKQVLDIAVDAAAQVGAMKLLTIAKVLKGVQAGQEFSAATRTQLEALGLDSKGVSALEESVVKTKALPSDVPTSTTPGSAVKELPAPAAAKEVAAAATPPAVALDQTAQEAAKKTAEEAARKTAEETAKETAKETGKQVAAVKPTGTDIQPTTPGAASANPQEAASKALEAVKPTGVPAQAPLQLQGPSPADIASGKINPEAFAKLSPESKEFLFQMAQLGGIGALDAKLKGENAAVGAAEWMAMGAAIHGAFAGLERSGMSLKMAESSAPKVEILGPGEMPKAPEVHESFNITTNNGTKIVSENGQYTVNGKPADVKLSKVGDDYRVQYHMHDEPEGTWTRFDQANKNGTKFMETNLGEIHADSTGSGIGRVELKSGEKFEKGADGKWQEYKKDGDKWVATTDNANGGIKDVSIFQPKPGEPYELDVTYNNQDVRTFSDKGWSDQASTHTEPVAPKETVEPATPPAAKKPSEPLEGEIIPPVRPQTATPPANVDPFALRPSASPILDQPALRPFKPGIGELDPALPGRQPSMFERPTQDVVPAGRPEVAPERVAPTTDVVPAVKDPVPSVIAEPAPEPKLPATQEKLPVVREQGEPVPARPIESEPVPPQKGPLLTPQQEAILASQGAGLVPRPGANDNREKVEAPPVKPLDVPPPNPANAPVEPLQPSATLAALATVKNWEGPFHSSDRVLQAVLGRRPTFEEVRSLTRAMQDQFKLDHNGQDIKTVGLKHGDQFLTAQNAESTIGLLAKSNPELAAQMRAYMQVDHDLGAKLGRAPAIDEVRAVSSQLQQNFLAQNHLQSLAQADAQQWQSFAAANDDGATLQTLETNDERLQRIAQTYQETGKLPPDGIISQRAFPSSAGNLHHHHRRHAARR